MKIIIEKDLPELYYIHNRYGNLRSWGSQKTFVRIPYKKKNGTWGSKYYCSSAGTALLFETKEDAERFEGMYNTKGDIKKLIFPDGIKLKEIVINGQKCLQINGYQGGVRI